MERKLVLLFPSFIPKSEQQSRTNQQWTYICRPPVLHYQRMASILEKHVTSLFFAKNDTMHNFNTEKIGIPALYSCTAFLHCMLTRGEYPILHTRIMYSSTRAATCLAMPQFGKGRAALSHFTEFFGNGTQTTLDLLLQLHGKIGFYIKIQRRPKRALAGFGQPTAATAPTLQCS